jgi:hypothetical protein
MPKKKKDQTGGPEAPVNDTVFLEGAAQGAADQQVAADQQAQVGQTTLPEDVAELVRATLKVAIAQRKLYALATTLTSLTRVIAKALGGYVDGIPTSVLRDFIRREIQTMGYPLIYARVNYAGLRYVPETVVLYKNFDEIVEIVRSGRVDSLKAVVAADGIDPIYDSTEAGGNEAARGRP